MSLFLDLDIQIFKRIGGPPAWELIETAPMQQRLGPVPQTTAAHLVQQQKTGVAGLSCGAQISLLHLAEKAPAPLQPASLEVALKSEKVSNIVSGKRTRFMALRT